MRRRNDYVIGVKEAMRVLDNLPMSIRNSTITNSGKRSLKPVAREAKRSFLKNAKNTNKQGFSKVKYIAKGIKVMPIKNRKRPGARVAIKGPSINMGRRDWLLQGAAKLFSAGSYKTRNRKGKGYFRGFGNFIADAAEKLRNRVALTFTRELENEMKKGVARTMRRYGKRG